MREYLTGGEKITSGLKIIVRLPNHPLKVVAIELDQAPTSITHSNTKIRMTLTGKIIALDERMIPHPKKFEKQPELEVGDQVKIVASLGTNPRVSLEKLS